MNSQQSVTQQSIPQQAQTLGVVSQLMVYVMLIEIFIAEIGYQLAARKIQSKKFAPDLNGLRTGIIEMIPGFSQHFAKATVNPQTNEIEWPEDRTKTGLVEGSYDYFEKMSTIALGLIPLIHPKAMELAASRVYHERTLKEDTAYPPKYSDALAMQLGEKLPEILRELRQWLASKVIFYATSGMKLIRDNGYMASFNPRTAIGINDIKKFMDAQINVKVEDVAASVDHSVEHQDDLRSTDQEAMVSPWDIRNAINSNTDMFDLDEDTANQVRDLQKATIAFYSWLMKAEDYLITMTVALEETRVKAKEYIDNRTKANAIISSIPVQ